jgi:dolichyl-phosphate beta-glucosyltransferase
MTNAHVTWVVPCFDEAQRLDRDAFLALADGSPRRSVVFVDDGSHDGTLALLTDLAQKRPERIEVVPLSANQGKAEAVRRGMLHALAGPAEVIGYCDADLATPPAELERLAQLACDGAYDILMGSRVQLLGRTIKRNGARHYVGRVFATCASMSLGLPVYDTQCGAKLFRRGEALAAALATPFASRWAFDVELLGRLLRPAPGTAAVDIARIREEPLQAWTDVPGSKLHPLAAMRGGLDLIRLAWRTLRPR